MGSYLAAIDIGSSQIRCLVFSTRGRLRGSASADLPIRLAPSLGPLARELSPRSLWSLAGRLMREAITTAAIDPAAIAAVAVTSQREGLAIVDDRGRELYLAPNTDLRAFMEGQAIDAKQGDLVYATTGHTPSFLLAPAKVHWLRDNRPDPYAGIRHILSLDAWLAGKLGAAPALEQSAAVELGLAGVAFGTVATDLLDTLGIAKRLVPPVVAAGGIIGDVSPAAARHTGLPAGTPIAAAGPDTQCGLLGMGVEKPGDAGIVAGWSAPVQVVLNRPLLDLLKRTWTGRHVTGRWVLESTAADAGSAYRWAKGTLFPGLQAAALARLVAQVPPGSNGALAFLGPRVANMGAVGSTLGGFLFPLLSSIQPTDPAALLRAAIENVAYGLKANVSQLEAISSARLGRLTLGGGMAQNRLLASILADVLGREVLIARSTEITGLGAAMCAAVGAGMYADLNAASRGMSSLFDRIQPHPVRTLEYVEHYTRWLAAGQSLESLGGTL